MDTEAERTNRAVLERLGLTPKALSNAMQKDLLGWLQRTLHAPFKLDALDLLAIAAYVTLTQQTRLTNRQAGAVAGALRSGFDREPNARTWFVSYDNEAQRWRVASSPPPEGVGLIGLDIGKLKARLAALRDLVAEELGCVPEHLT
jgi:hypothetical protein